MLNQMVKRTPQLSITFPPGWGGKRKRAGRKPVGKRAGVPHRDRPRFRSALPVLVTMRVQVGVPSLRGKGCRTVVREAIRKGRERPGFRIVEYSIQGNHLHFVVEAADQTVLARGIQGLSVRIARRLNRFLQRKGTLFADRYHSRPLKTPRQVRNGLVYVLNNAKKHAAERGERWRADAVDGCSSAAHFGGWCRSVHVVGGSVPRDRVTLEPAHWLLTTGWRRRGLLDPGHVPGPMRRL